MKLDGVPPGGDIRRRLGKEGLVDPGSAIDFVLFGVQYRLSELHQAPGTRGKSILNQTTGLPDTKRRTEPAGPSRNAIPRNGNGK